MLLALGRSLRQSAGQVHQARAALARRAYGAAAHADEHDDDHHEQSYDHTPTVFDRLISINVVDLHGRRHAVKGLVGQTLAKTLIDAGFPATYFFPNMGFYTQHIVDAHVFIPKDYWQFIPNFKPDSDEADAIRRTFREVVQDFSRDTSYLASYVTLKPEMNNMTVGIGPIRPWYLHYDWCFGGEHGDPASQFGRKSVTIFG